MLQWDWPQVWTVDNREAVRVAMESALRKAMSGASQNAQIRGTVSVDLPHLGSSPPEVILSGIRELSLEHTALMVKVRYDGDFAVTLRGLEINLDTIGSGGGADEVDGNYAMPFYCPLDLTLHDIYVDGMASIEVFQEFEESPSYNEAGRGRAGHGRDAAPIPSLAQGGGGSLPGLTPRRTLSPSAGISLSTFSRDPGRQQAGVSNAEAGYSGFSSPSPSRAVPTGRTSGYGVLLGAGGRRAMRPPPTVIDDRAQPRRPALSSSSPEPSRNARRTSADPLVPRSRSEPPPRRSLADLQSHKVRVLRRTLKVQLFGDPLKSFRVQTNFASVPGANQKVEGTIKMLLKPTIDRLMTEGITITLS